MYIKFNGFQAGGWGPLGIVDMPSPDDDLQTDRTDVLGRDGQVAGPDYLRKAIWNITLLVNTYSYEEGTALVRKVRDAWWDPKYRQTSAMAPLSYSKDGVTWHRVYGRPLKFSGPPQGTRLDQGVAHIELQFEQLDPVHYSEARSSTRIESSPGRASRGWSSPFVFPLVSGHLSDPIEQRLVNEGNVPAPMLVTFGGAMSDPRLTNLQNNLVIGVSGSLNWDERITIDVLSQKVYRWRLASPGSHTPVPGRLIRQSRLSKLYAPPGETDWQLRYSSAENGFAELSINSTYSSMQ